MTHRVNNTTTSVHLKNPTHGLHLPTEQVRTPPPKPPTAPHPPMRPLLIPLLCVCVTLSHTTPIGPLLQPPTVYHSPEPLHQFFASPLPSLETFPDDISPEPDFTPEPSHLPLLPTLPRPPRESPKHRFDRTSPPPRVPPRLKSPSPSSLQPPKNRVTASHPPVPSSTLSSIPTALSTSTTAPTSKTQITTTPEPSSSLWVTPQIVPSPTVEKPPSPHQSNYPEQTYHPIPQQSYQPDDATPFPLDSPEPSYLSEQFPAESPEESPEESLEVSPDSSDVPEGTAPPGPPSPGLAPTFPPSETVPPGQRTPCFPASATVQLSDGTIKTMRQLSIGDQVHVGGAQYSRVHMFTHRVYNTWDIFIKITTSSGRVLKVTGGHFIYIGDTLRQARDARIGDSLPTAEGTWTTVTAVQEVIERGLYNPQTATGDIVVDGIRASAYTEAVKPSLAHAALLPLRVAFSLFGLSTQCAHHGYPDFVPSALRSMVAAA